MLSLTPPARYTSARSTPPRLEFPGDTPVFQPRLSWVEAERRRVEAEEAKAGTAKAGTAKLRQLELDELGDLVEELKSEQTLTKKELMQRINERGAVATRSQIEKVLAGAWYKASNCVICLERTVQSGRRMYELCSHWVCSGCRRKQASMPGVLRCPLCRTVHPRSPEEQRTVQIQRERFMVPPRAFVNIERAFVNIDVDDPLERIQAYLQRRAQYGPSYGVTAPN